jgi:hypothetical protein
MPRWAEPLALPNARASPSATPIEVADLGAVRLPTNPLILLLEISLTYLPTYLTARQGGRLRHRARGRGRRQDARVDGGGGHARLYVPTLLRPSRTPVLPYSRTPVLPYSRTPVLPYSRTASRPPSLPTLPAPRRPITACHITSRHNDQRCPFQPAPLCPFRKRTAHSRFGSGQPTPSRRASPPPHPRSAANQPRTPFPSAPLPPSPPPP